MMLEAAAAAVKDATLKSPEKAIDPAILEASELPDIIGGDKEIVDLPDEIEFIPENEGEYAGDLQDEVRIKSPKLPELNRESSEVETLPDEIDMMPEDEISDGIPDTGGTINCESASSHAERHATADTSDGANPEDKNDADDSQEAEKKGGSELSEEEINAKQVEAIKNGLERIRNGEELSYDELGNLGEMMMDQYYISQGYKPLNKHRVTSLDDKKSGFNTGIDGVYEKTNPDGSKTYVIADAKYNKSQQSQTKDGLQMCDNWIENRLDNAVGKEKADEIRDAAEDNPDSVKHEIYHIEPKVDSDGNTHTDIQPVDSEGHKTGEKIIVEYFDKAGNRVDPSETNNDEEAEQ